MKTVQGIPRNFSAGETARAARYIGHDQRRFDKVMNEFFKGPYRHNQRAAGALVLVVRDFPEMLGPHLRRMLVQLDKKDNVAAVTRNILRLLQYVEIPATLQGRAVNSAMRILEDPDELVAAKVFSMTLLANVAREHKELQLEIREAIERQYPYGTAAFRSRARRTLIMLDR